MGGLWIVGLVAATLLATVRGQDCGDDMIYDEDFERCYSAGTTAIAGRSASNACGGADQSLALPESDEENTHVQELLPSGGDSWLGISGGVDDITLRVDSAPFLCFDGLTSGDVEPRTSDSPCYRVIAVDGLSTQGTNIYSFQSVDDSRFYLRHVSHKLMLSDMSMADLTDEQSATFTLVTYVGVNNYAMFYSNKPDMTTYKWYVDGARIIMYPDPEGTMSSSHMESAFFRWEDGVHYNVAGQNDGFVIEAKERDGFCYDLPYNSEVVERKKDCMTYKVKPGINNEANTISFESVDHPNYYLRYENNEILLKLIAPPVSSTSAAARDSSFTPVRDESDPAAMLYELQLFSDATKKVAFDGSLGLLTTTTISGSNTLFPILQQFTDANGDAIASDRYTNFDTDPVFYGCGLIEGSTGDWSTQSCSNELPVVCQAEPTNGGTADPHLTVHVKGSHTPICFDIHGFDKDAMRLLDDEEADVKVNAEFIGKNGTDTSYFNVIFVVSKTCFIRVMYDNFEINGIPLEWDEEIPWTSCGVDGYAFKVYADGKRGYMVVEPKNNMQFTIVRDIGKFFPTDPEPTAFFLDFFITKKGGLSQHATGILGQFGQLEVSVKETGEEGRAVMTYPQYPLRPAVNVRKIQRTSVMHDSVYSCWMVDNEGEGFIRGETKDYLVPHIYWERSALEASIAFEPDFNNPYDAINAPSVNHFNVI